MYDEAALFPTRHPWKCPGCGIKLHEVTVIMRHKERCKEFKQYLEKEAKRVSS